MLRVPAFTPWAQRVAYPRRKSRTAAARALSRELKWSRQRPDERLHSSVGRRLPLLRSRDPEEAQRTARDEMALVVEGVVDGGMDREKSLG
jgi:hypothetical protein